MYFSIVHDMYTHMVIYTACLFFFFFILGDLLTGVFIIIRSFAPGR